MAIYGYMKIKYDQIPKEIIENYNLERITHK